MCHDEEESVNQLQNELNKIETNWEKLREIALNACKKEPVINENRDTINKLKADMVALEKTRTKWFKENDCEEIERQFEEIKPKYENHRECTKNCQTDWELAKRSLQERVTAFEDMKSEVENKLTIKFAKIMATQSHVGKVDIDYENESLIMRVKLKGHDTFENIESETDTDNDNNNNNNVNTRFQSNKKKFKKNKNNENEAIVDEVRGNGKNRKRTFKELEENGVTNTKTLSGGERSFTQIAFILALQEFCGSPFCIYDEFDVFMDSVNRGNSVRILIETAKKQQGNRQYIFITPHDVSPMMKHGDEKIMTCHKLAPPRQN